MAPKQNLQKKKKNQRKREEGQNLLIKIINQNQSQNLGQNQGKLK